MGVITSIFWRFIRNASVIEVAADGDVGIGGFKDLCGE